jgi:hypothetical protein
MPKKDYHAKKDTKRFLISHKKVIKQALKSVEASGIWVRPLRHLGLTLAASGFDPSGIWV